MHIRNRRTNIPIATLLAATLCAAGCGAPMAGGVKEMEEPPKGSEEEIKAITADPVIYMNKCLTEARRVKSARIQFERQERLGLVPELRPAEKMRCEFREEPFSVRFTWTDEKPEYLQAVYVEGQNGNKVSLLPRVGLFGTRPNVVAYPADFAVTFGKSKKPITDFGPRLMLERLFDRIEKAKQFGGAKIRYTGLAVVGPGNEKCHHIELLFPKPDEFPCKLLDLYINIDTRLPVAVYLWLTEEDRVRTNKTLDAMYIYGLLEPNVPLSDDDFVIDVDPRGK
ncbi:MAG: DUF1571 domain-containing protein [Phycisphaerae bacterium]|nr:DUF1571 domain-containing protein [Phycisphaerae bacterium]